MTASVIVIAAFTAALTTQLTTKTLRGLVHGGPTCASFASVPCKILKRSPILTASRSATRTFPTLYPDYAPCGPDGSTPSSTTNRCSPGR